MRVFFHFLACLSLLVATGCKVPNNGEGYTGISKVPDNAPGRDLTAVLYYWVETGYQCTLSTGQRIYSYRGAVQVGANQYIQYSDFCQMQILKTGALSDLEIDTDLLGLEKNIF